MGAGDASARYLIGMQRLVEEAFHEAMDVGASVKYFKKLDKFIKKDGLIITNINDHKDTFMHVSPDLSELRDEFDKKGYKDISDTSIYGECDPKNDGSCSKQLFIKEK